MPDLSNGFHLDFCCGYGTFLAQLGWRFPDSQLFGLNIDYAGPHALVNELLNQAGVFAILVQADARKMPFADDKFTSASCFLGLQDIKISFGDKDLRNTLIEATRVLHSGGILVLIDEFSFKQFDALLQGLPLVVQDRCERSLDVTWNLSVAERAIRLYAEGYVKQKRLNDKVAKARFYEEIYSRMMNDMESQLARQGYYVPFGPIRMVVMNKIA